MKAFPCFLCGVWPFKGIDREYDYAFNCSAFSSFVLFSSGDGFGAFRYQNGILQRICALQFLQIYRMEDLAWLIILPQYRVKRASWCRVMTTPKNVDWTSSDDFTLSAFCAIPRQATSQSHSLVDSSLPEIVSLKIFSQIPPSACQTIPQSFP